MQRRPVIGTIILVVAVVLATASQAMAFTLTNPWAFYASGYWEQKAVGQPLDAHSADYIAAWKAMSSNQKINLVTTDAFGWDYFTGVSTDPIWTCTAQGGTFVFHASKNLKSDTGSDHEMTIRDTTANGGLNGGVEYEFGGVSSVNATNHTCTASYRSVSYLNSNGLDGALSQSNDKRNTGHRGLSCMTFGEAWSEVTGAHLVAHIVKLTIPKTGSSPYLTSPVQTGNHVFPYVGDEGNNSDIPEGMRVRLKSNSTVNAKIAALTNLAARAMAQGLQTYGSIISDQGSAGINIKLQTFNRTGALNWSSVGISATSLSTFTIDDFEFVQAGFNPGYAGY